jgi:heptosyltransferase-2
MKILIELPTWLGDSVMSTPAIENIVNSYIDPQITLIGSTLTVEALKSHPKVVKTKVLDKDYISLYKTAKNLGKFDAFFSFRSSLRSNFLKFFVVSKNKYQFNKNIYKNRHQVEKYNDFINESINLNKPAGELILHKEEFNLANKNLMLGINPGASYGSAKRWYPEEFAKVAAELSHKYDIYIFGATDEQSIAFDIEHFLVKMGVTNFKNLSGGTTIAEVIQHISQLDLFITGDSGPMHVAASFKVPTIAIFGPTKDKETSQWMNKKSINLKKTLDCQPCMQRTCPLGHHKCMKLIKAVDVLNAVKSFK